MGSRTVLEVVSEAGGTPSNISYSAPNRTSGGRYTGCPWLCQVLASHVSNSVGQNKLRLFWILQPGFIDGGLLGALSDNVSP